MTKVAIITGISKGFGFAVAQVLTVDKWHVVGDARSVPELTTAVRLLKSEQVTGIPGDVNDESHVKELINAGRSIGQIRLIINNASSLGEAPLRPLQFADTTIFRSTLSTNVVAPLRLMQMALPDLTETDGVIVNITSDAAKEDYPNWGPYSASKIALEKLSSIMSNEVEGVRIYSLDPGDMQTEMHQAAFPGEDISDRALPAAQAPSVLKLLELRPPSGRYTASEILSGSIRT